MTPIAICLFQQKGLLKDPSQCAIVMIYRVVLDNIPHYKNLGHVVNTVIHVGAHEAEELKYYATNFKAKNILLLEPNPDKYNIITSRIKEVEKISDSTILFYPIAAGFKSGKSTLTSFSGRSSGLASILKPKINHIKATFGRDPLELACNGGGVDKPSFEHTIYISTLSKVVQRHPHFQFVDLLVVDTQGFELEVLKGFSKYLKDIKSIDLEVTRNKEMGFYEHNPSESECSAFLLDYGFAPDFAISSFWGEAQHGRLLYRNKQK